MAGDSISSLVEIGFGFFLLVDWSQWCFGDLNYLLNAPMPKKEVVLELHSS
jgi:hypothetical protein